MLDDELAALESGAGGDVGEVEDVRDVAGYEDDSMILSSVDLRG